MFKSYCILNPRKYRFNNLSSTPTGVAVWVGCCPVNWKVAGLISSQGTCLVCGPGPQLGACERQLTDVSLVHWCFYLFHSPSFPLSLNINKIFKIIMSFKYGVRVSSFSGRQCLIQAIEWLMSIHKKLFVSPSWWAAYNSL